MIIGWCGLFRDRIWLTAVVCDPLLVTKVFSHFCRYSQCFDGFILVLQPAALQLLLHACLMFIHIYRYCSLVTVSNVIIELGDC